MKITSTLFLITLTTIIGCGNSAHSKYMQNRSIDEQIADEQREEAIKEQESERQMRGSVNKTMDDFNRKAMEKQPATKEEE